MDGAIIREFETENFRVVVEALQEDDLDLSWDDSGETREGLENGSLISFCAHAYVEFKPTGQVLSDDYLGNCIYESLDAFADHKECGRQQEELRAQGSNAIVGSYFADMVRIVCKEARTALWHIKDKTNSVKMREG